MKKSKIKKAMKKNTVWCTHEEYAPGILLCKELNCPFKGDEGRLAKPKELKKCRSFQITKPTDKFENSVSVLIPKKQIPLTADQQAAELRSLAKQKDEQHSKAIEQLQEYVKPLTKKHRASAS